MFRSVAVAIALVPAAAAAQDSDRGHALAVRWCANCHVVEGTATVGRADGTPSFPAIAAKPGTDANSLHAAMTAQHGRMPDLSLSKREQDDLAAYILGLRQRQ